MKRTQQVGSGLRGKPRIRKELKKAQTRAERRAENQQLQKAPEETDRTRKRRYFGWDD